MDRLLAVYASSAAVCIARAAASTISGSPASLDTFDWVYQRGLDEHNVRTLSFMLAALAKNNVASGMVEVFRVACECGVVGALDKNIAKKAMATLTDLNDMDLLDAGEPEIVDAVARATAAEDI